MAEKEIRHAQFVYSVEKEMADPHDADKTVKRLSRRIANRGQIVDIPRDEDIERGEAAGAFVTEEERAAEAEVEEETEEEDEESESSPESTSHDELVAWIRDDKPSAAKVIAAADNDPRKAEALLDAEYEASGGQSRKSVVTALEKIENR